MPDDITQIINEKQALAKKLAELEEKEEELRAAAAEELAETFVAKAQKEGHPGTKAEFLAVLKGTTARTRPLSKGSAKVDFTASGIMYKTSANGRTEYAKYLDDEGEQHIRPQRGANAWSTTKRNKFRNNHIKRFGENP